MSRFAVVLALAVVTPIRRALVELEHRLVVAETDIRLRRRRAESDGWFVGALLCLSLATVGCGGRWERPTRSALDVTAHALVAADEVLAPAYRAAAFEALEEAETRADYDARMRRWDAAETAARTAASALRTAETAVDAGDHGATLAAVPCVAQALHALVETLVHAGVRVPRQLADAARTVAALTSGACPVPTEAAP